jgi:hypothetical protein
VKADVPPPVPRRGLAFSWHYAAFRARLRALVAAVRRRAAAFSRDRSTTLHSAMLMFDFWWTANHASWRSFRTRWKPTCDWQRGTGATSDEEHEHDQPSVSAVVFGSASGLAGRAGVTAALADLLASENALGC